MIVSARHITGRQTVWLLFFCAVLAAWMVLFAMQPGIELPAGWQDLGVDYLASLCRPTAGDAGYAPIFVMWCLMALAMMAPTVVPALHTFSDLTHTQGAGVAEFVALVGGYLLVWIGFSAVAATVQVALANEGLLDPWGRNTVILLNVALLAFAGLYQFSTLKESCLKSCRSPMIFFLSRWRDGPSGAFHMGFQMGAICLGCCWPLMLLAFVAGPMNLAFMGLAMLLMTLEKLPSVGRHLTIPMGVVLILGAALIVISTFATGF